MVKYTVTVKKKVY